MCVSTKIKIHHMVVSENSGTPKSSILIGFSTINHPFWGTTIFGNTYVSRENLRYISSKKSTGRSPAPTPHRHLQDELFERDQLGGCGRKIGKRIEIVTSNSNAVCTCYSMVTIYNLYWVLLQYPKSTKTRDFRLPTQSCMSFS